jgi:hypothetical protein
MQTSRRMLPLALRAALVFASPPTASLLGGAQTTANHVTTTTTMTAGHEQKLIYPAGIREYDADKKVIVELSKEEEWGGRKSSGVFHQNETAPTYRDGLVGRISSYAERPPVRQPIGTRESNAAFLLRSFTRTSGQTQHFETEVRSWMVHHQA